MPGHRRSGDTQAAAMCGRRFGAASRLSRTDQSVLEASTVSSIPTRLSDRRSECSVGRDVDELADPEDHAPDAECAKSPRRHRQPPVQGTITRHRLKPLIHSGGQAAQIPEERRTHSKTKQKEYRRTDHTQPPDHQTAETQRSPQDARRKSGTRNRNQLTWTYGVACSWRQIWQLAGPERGLAEPLNDLALIFPGHGVI